MVEVRLPKDGRRARSTGCGYDHTIGALDYVANRLIPLSCYDIRHLPLRREYAFEYTNAGGPEGVRSLQARCSDIP